MGGEEEDCLRKVEVKYNGTVCVCVCFKFWRERERERNGICLKGAIVYEGMEKEREAEVSCLCSEQKGRFKCITKISQGPRCIMHII